MKKDIKFSTRMASTDREKIRALAAKARSAYGARELRRAVDRAVEQAFADRIASGTANTGQHWTADCSADGSIILREDETVTM